MQTVDKPRQDIRDQMVANLIETVGNLEAMTKSTSRDCNSGLRRLLELDEIVTEMEIIGARLRLEMQAVSGRGLLMFAKVILDHATTTRMG